MIDYWLYIMMFILCCSMFCYFTGFFNSPSTPDQLKYLMEFMHQKLGVKWDKKAKAYVPYRKGGYIFEWCGKLGNERIQITFLPIGNMHHVIKFGKTLEKHVMINWCTCDKPTDDIFIGSFVSSTAFNYNIIEFFNIILQNCRLSYEEEIYVTKTILEQL